jgi:hypothetical protein
MTRVGRAAPIVPISRWTTAALALCFVACAACEGSSESLTDGADAVTLSKRDEEQPWRAGQRFPDTAETTVIGIPAGKIRRGTSAYGALVRCEREDIAFKDEEGTGADRMMTPRLLSRLERLSAAVSRRWPDSRLRVTEAWDERGEHGDKSAHYEGRAADITTDPRDPKKLGHLARMAVYAGLDWVFYEDDTHVHVSVRR